jgi:hypothetical protein
MSQSNHWYDMLKQYVSNIERFDFELIAWEMFQYQSRFNPLYKNYLEAIDVDHRRVIKTEQIPFLPISLFKNHEIKTQEWASEAVFTSSGTTGAVTSQHHVRDLEWYLMHCENGFEQFYGNLEQYCVLALLPSYLEREGSSLVDMAARFIKRSKHKSSGFFLQNHADLKQILEYNCLQNIPTLLLGVTFGLLDFAEQNKMQLSDNVMIMETGGMKGRRKEMTRTEVHQILTAQLGVKKIHSEYGMTELLSQGYSRGNGIFKTSDSMRVYLREINDPFSFMRTGKNGCLNIIDLANIDSCSFLATDDLGSIFEDGTFEIKGRIDHSDVRGCNLMI